ncbi:MAG: rod shape-determining protein [Oscillospiraceae bacterium]|nr:rod shape-determining protein [Oscillospiraceae bacterium]
MKLYSKNIGIDLGTSNVLIYQEGKGIVLREPAVVAMDRNTGRMLHVGAAARNMLGRTPGHIIAVHPLTDGAIADYELTVQMLSDMVKRVVKGAIIKPCVVISIPSGVTEVEERAVIQAAMEAGARRVYLIEEVRAAALGAQINMDNPTGRMVVDIGGGTTDIGILTMNEVAYSTSLKVAGQAFDEAIIRYLRKNHGISIGQNTAEDIKLTIGCVMERPSRQTMIVTGRDFRTGLSTNIELHSDHILEALRRPARQIVEKIAEVVDMVTPELAADVARNGIVLTGGGAQIWGMDQLIAERMQTNCTLADEADFCVAFGCGKSLQWVNHMSEGPINVSRRSKMRGY